jgi:hypothetical protein
MLITSTANWIPARKQLHEWDLRGANPTDQQIRVQRPAFLARLPSNALDRCSER